VRRNDKKAAELGQLELFRKCRPSDLRRLASIADKVTFEPGEVLCQEGRKGHDCYVIANGEAEVSVGGQSVAVVGRGDVVGEIAVLDGGRRTASVVAVDEVHTYAIEQRRVDDLLERAPAIARAMLEQLSNRLRHLDEQLAATSVPGSRRP